MDQPLVFRKDTHNGTVRAKPYTAAILKMDRHCCQTGMAEVRVHHDERGWKDERGDTGCKRSRQPLKRFTRTRARYGMRRVIAARIGNPLFLIYGRDSCHHPVDINDVRPCHRMILMCG